MKANKIKHKSDKKLIVLLGLIAFAAIVIGIIAGYDQLRNIWLEQCAITDFASQVTIKAGKMVKPDVIAENLGLKIGANLATINFAKKRADLLKRVPNLKSIVISRQLPDKISIVTEEREPVARLGIHGRKSDNGKVVDNEGVVFICQRGTKMLPIIREATAPGTRPGERLEGRSRAALTLLETSRDPEFSELGILDVDIHKPDFISATLGSNYSTAKIAWEEMDMDTPSSRANLTYQLRHLVRAIRSHVGDGTVVWNATDTSRPGRIYADTKRNLK